jgi:hypothetical protein
MYGLVNQGVRKMVTETFGSDVWDAIREKAGVEDVFAAMEPYPDDVTVSLVIAASEVLGITPDEVLHAFGKWWIGNAAREYGELFTMTGDSFEEFTSNLNTIHTRVAYMLPKLTPPSFKITDRNDESFLLHYHSERDGLFPMVHGMIEGIGEWFETPVTVEQTRCTADGCEHDVYIVRHG